MNYYFLLAFSTALAAIKVNTDRIIDSNRLSTDIGSLIAFWAIEKHKLIPE